MIKDNEWKMRIFRDEKTMNPSNFDIYLNINEIPVNIETENLSELKHRLQKLMPLSKTVHLNLTDGITRELDKEYTFNLKFSLKIQNKRVEIK